jgi:hypothetical protein
MSRALHVSGEVAWAQNAKKARFDRLYLVQTIVKGKRLNSRVSRASAPIQSEPIVL